MKKLRRSRADIKILGVCAGIGHYFSVDPTLVRVVYLTVTVFSGFVPGIITYLLLAWIMPNEE